MEAIVAKKVLVQPPTGKAALWLILPDIHFPDHEPQALEIVKKVASTLKPTNTLLLGDVLDCGIFSKHDMKAVRELADYDYQQLEVDPCNQFLDFIQDHTQQMTHFLEGNHEQRIERWAVDAGRVGQEIYKLIAPKETVGKRNGSYRKKFNMVPYDVSTGNRMGFVQIVQDSPKMDTGGLVAVHGWSWAKSAARVHLEKSRSQSIVFGHTHRAQMEASRDPWTGKTIIAFNPGTLSKLQPLYQTGGNPSEWSHGFALVYVGATSWTQYIIPINKKGSCVLPDGREVKV
jgi:predicted phosphodiesterase